MKDVTLEKADCVLAAMGKALAFPERLGPNTRALLADAYDVVQAYLAEHPADDGEAVTEEWLRSIGFEDWSGADDVRLFGPKHYFMFNRSKETQTVTWWFGSGVGPFPTPATRRAVRDLCRALGIPLKEPA